MDLIFPSEDVHVAAPLRRFSHATPQKKPSGQARIMPGEDKASENLKGHGCKILWNTMVILQTYFQDLSSFELESSSVVGRNRCEGNASDVACHDTLSAA
jgi:hypothetical protein